MERYKLINQSINKLKSTTWIFLRKSLSWLLILVPFLVLIFLFLQIYEIGDSISANIFEFVFFEKIPSDDVSSYFRIFFSVLFALIIWFLVYSFSTNYIWKLIHQKIEKIIMSFPFAWSVYKISKDFSQYFKDFWSNRSKKFWLVVLVQYPFKWAYVLWAISNMNDIFIDWVVSVYIPTAPNPTSWFNVLYDKKDIKVLDVSIEDMMKFVLWLWIVKIEVFEKTVKSFKSLPSLEDVLKNWNKSLLSKGLLKRISKKKKKLN